jgi:hypothetical protein
VPGPGVPGSSILLPVDARCSRSDSNRVSDPVFIQIEVFFVLQRTAAGSMRQARQAADTDIQQQQHLHPHHHHSVFVPELQPQFGGTDDRGYQWGHLVNSPSPGIPDHRIVGRSESTTFSTAASPSTCVPFPHSQTTLYQSLPSRPLTRGAQRSSCVDTNQHLLFP